MFSPSPSSSFSVDHEPRIWSNFTHYSPKESFLRKGPSSSKRKAVFYNLTDDVKPSKILVTEEMMANQLDGIHLSSDYTSHGIQETLTNPTPSTSGTSPLSFDLRNSLPKLTICDELRALKDSLTILPKVLEPERPSNALILWQPPAGDLGKYLQYQIDKQKDSEPSEKKSDAEATETMAEEDRDVKVPTNPVDSGMDVELENNNTDMTCAYTGFSRAI